MVSLSWNYKNKANLKSFSVSITISNPKNIDLKGAEFTFSNNPAYFFNQDFVITNNISNYTLTFERFANRTCFHSKNDFNFNIQLNKKGKVLCSIKLGILYRNLLNEHFDNKEKHNIYIYGPPGVGKSSFINSLYILFSSKKDSTFDSIPTDPNSDHCTTKFTRYRIFDIHTKKTTEINAFDMWGEEEGTYSDSTFSSLLRGGWEIGSSMAKMEPTLFRMDSHSPDSKLIPGCFIFMITASDLISESKNVDSINWRIRQAIKANVNYILVITKVDEQDSNLRPDNTDEISISDNDCEDLCTQASKKFGCRRNRVFPLLNYQSELLKTVNMDRWIYRIIYNAINQSQTSQLSDFEKLAFS